MNLTFGNKQIEALFILEEPKPTAEGTMNTLQIVTEDLMTSAELKALLINDIKVDDGRIFKGYTSLSSVSVLLYKEEIPTPDTTIDELLELASDEVAIQYTKKVKGMKFDGAPIKPRTRINWNGKLMRAKEGVEDKIDFTPELKPELWEEVK